MCLNVYETVNLGKFKNKVFYKVIVRKDGAGALSAAKKIVDKFHVDKFHAKKKVPSKPQTVSAINEAIKKKLKLNSPIFDTEWKPGWKVAARALKIGIPRHTINGGAIHVYRSLQHLKDSNWLKNRPDRFVLKVTANSEDLLGCNNKEAAFTKVFLSQKEYDRAIEKMRKRCCKLWKAYLTLSAR